jgi:two-component system NtrC family sensor kinase
MKPRTLKKTLLWSFLLVIFSFSICIAILGYGVIKNDIIKRSQRQVQESLKAARMVLYDEVNLMGKMLDIVSASDNLNEIKNKLGFDYIFVVDQASRFDSGDGILDAAFKRQKAGGIRIISKEELIKMGAPLYEKSKIDVIFTLKAGPQTINTLENAMAIEYARPLSDGRRVIYAGKIINRDFELVDKIRNLVFENKLYKDKPLGTVTIFYDDIRITTNVLNNKGQRAVGTRVSKIVYDRVMNGGSSWVDRAFVVNNWYLTAYEPIKDINGRTIGILYVGLLEAPFHVLARNILLVFLLILISTVALVSMFSIFLASVISRPVTGIVNVIERFTAGNFDSHVTSDTSVTELNKLAESFNDMADKLNESYKELRLSNDKMLTLNKRYLDLISFVSHELKGILSSTILNTYTVRDGLLGMVNFKQQKALNSITRNLDYLDSTVRSFLSLSRIEKGEMTVNKSEVLLKEEIFDVSLETFQKQINEAGINIVDNIENNLKAVLDRDLMLIVANNLISNAIKYGKNNGRIILSSKVDANSISIEVYNDGYPISAEDVDKLFRRFSRLDNAQTRSSKGTGLGLFITRQIIEQHGGSIEVRPGSQGNSFIFEIQKEDNQC